MLRGTGDHERRGIERAVGIVVVAEHADRERFLTEPTGRIVDRYRGLVRGDRDRSLLRNRPEIVADHVTEQITAAETGKGRVDQGPVTHRADRTEGRLKGNLQRRRVD